MCFLIVISPYGYATDYLITTSVNGFGAGNNDVLLDGDTLTVNVAPGSLDTTTNLNGPISAVIFADGPGSKTVSNSGSITSPAVATFANQTPGSNLGLINITNTSTGTISAPVLADGAAFDFSTALSGSATITNAGGITGAALFPSAATIIFNNTGTIAYSVLVGNTVSLLEAAQNSPGTINNQATLNINGGSIQGSIADFGTVNVTADFSTAGAISNYNAMTVSGPATLTLNNPITTTASNATFTTANTATTRTTAANLLPPTGATVVEGFVDLNNFDQTAGDVISAGAGGGIILGTATLSFGTATPNTTFAGVVTGTTANVTMNGSGTAIWSNLNNSYAGTTTVNNGGTFQLSGRNFGSVVLNGSSLLTGTSHMFAVIPTASSITMTGSNLSLLGNSQVIGDFNGDGASIVDLGAGFLTFGTATDSTFSGRVLGSGGVTKNGAGRATWSSGTNDYTGLTTVNAGILELNGVNLGSVQLNTGATLIALGTDILMPSSSVTTATGSLFDFNTNFAQTIGDLSGAGTVNIRDTTLTVGSNTASVTFSGSVTGVLGAVVKQGTGTWILSGASSYAGGTQINAGTLVVNGSVTNASLFPVVVNPGATLRGLGGTIVADVTNNGTFAPGNGNSIGNLNITGNYTATPASVMSIQFDPAGPVSTATITANASIAGTLNIVANPGTYTPNQMYQFLTAANVSGQFSAITPTMIGAYKPIVLYHPGNLVIQLTLNRASIFPAAALAGANSNQISNQIALARYIDSLPNPPIGSDLGNIIGDLAQLSGQTLLDALESISPGRTSADSSVVQDMDAMVNAISALHLAELRDRAASDGSGAIASGGLRQTTKSDPMAFLKKIEGKSRTTAQKNFNTTRNGMAANANSQMQSLFNQGTNDRNLWIYGLGHFADQKPNKSDPGFDARTGGVVAGVDYSPCKNIFIGGGFGRSSSILSFDKNAGKDKIKNYFATVYGTWFPKPLYFDFSLIAGMLHYHDKQPISFPGVDRVATSNHKGFSGTPHLGVGYEIEMQNARVTPFANVDYSYSHEQKYSTQGANALNQNIAAKNSQLLRSEGGLKFEKTYKIESQFTQGDLIPQISLSVVNKKVLKKSLMNAGFVGQPGSYTLDYFNKSSNQVSPALGLLFKSVEGAFISARADAEIGKRYRSYELSLGAGLMF